MNLFGLTGAAISTAVCVYAAAAGGRPERIGALIVVAGLVAMPLVQDQVRWLDPHLRIAAIDVVQLSLFAYLTSTTRRNWVLYATAFQFLSLAADLLHHRDVRVHGRAYLTVVFLLGYGVVAALAVGTWQASRAATREGRGRRAGDDIPMEKPGRELQDGGERTW